MVVGGGGGGIQWRRWGLRIGDDETTMEIDMSGGGWQRRASAFDSCDGRSWTLAFDGGTRQREEARRDKETARRQDNERVTC